MRWCGQGGERTSQTRAIQEIEKFEKSVVLRRDEGKRKRRNYGLWRVYPK